MNPGQASRWIDRHFGNRKRNERSMASPPPEEELIEVLNQHPGLLIKGEKEQTALELFVRWLQSVRSLVCPFASFRSCTLFRSV